MTSTPSEFEPELLAFDQDTAPPGAVVFYGSSSFRLWENMAQSFPGYTVVNRGFGGSTLEECVAVLPRVFKTLRPSAIVLYAADNDLESGTTPEQTLRFFEQFVEQIRELFPKIPIAFVSIKPSPSRFWNLSNIRRANSLVRAASANHPGVAYLDVFPQMLSPAGGSRPELFTDDGLHMNSAGYDIWTTQIRAWLDTPPGLNCETRVPQMA